MPPPRLLFRSPLSMTFSSVAHSCQLPATRPLYRASLRAVRRSLHNGGLRNPNNTNTPTSLVRASRFRFTSSSPRPLKKRFSFPRRFNSTESTSSKTSSFSQRMSKLSREYGWSALGIYLALSALDFPFCFAAVRLLGVERIGHYEHVIVEGAKGIFEPLWPGSKEDNEQQGEDPGSSDLAMVGDTEDIHYDHGVVEAQKRNAEEGASIWTQLALAYAIHKSFIFIRVPLTAAVTPKVVRVLRRWGWNIGKRKPKDG